MVNLHRILLDTKVHSVFIISELCLLRLFELELFQSWRLFKHIRRTGFLVQLHYHTEPDAGVNGDGRIMVAHVRSKISDIAFGRAAAYYALFAS